MDTLTKQAQPVVDQGSGEPEDYVESPELVVEILRRVERVNNGEAIRVEDAFREVRAQYGL